MEVLPFDTLLNIFLRLPIEQIALASSVCKTWRLLLAEGPYSERIWKALSDRIYGGPKLENTSSWRISVCLATASAKKRFKNENWYLQHTNVLNRLYWAAERGYAVFAADAWRQICRTPTTKAQEQIDRKIIAQHNTRMLKSKLSPEHQQMRHFYNSANRTKLFYEPVTKGFCDFVLWCEPAGFGGDWNEALTNLAKTGQLEIFKKMAKMSNLDFSNHYLQKRLIEGATTGGNAPVLAWLFQLCRDEQEKQGKTNNTEFEASFFAELLGCCKLWKWKGEEHTIAIIEVLKECYKQNKTAGNKNYEFIELFTFEMYGTPINHSISYGNIYFLKWYLQQHPPKESVNEILGSVASSQTETRREMIDLILENGADINVELVNKRKENRTALDYAIRAKNIGTVCYLLSKGARFAKLDHEPTENLVFCVFTWNSVLQLPDEELIKHLDDLIVKYHSVIEFSPNTCSKQLGRHIGFYIAKYRPTARMLQWCIKELKIDINAKDKKGKTMLVLLIAHWGRVRTEPKDPLFDYLISEGAEININQNKNNSNLLAIACKHKSSTHVVKTLLQLGAQKDEIDESGKTPLHYAIYHKSKTHIDELLKAGADPLLCDKENMSPLAYAESLGKNGMSELLKNLPK